MQPYFAALGISRVAQQTNLDDIGIPCFASFRPASLTLSTNQGKGVSAADARASAVMEAVEFAIAEMPMVQSRLATLDELQNESTPVFWPSRLLPFGYLPKADAAIRWLSGYGLVSQQPCLVPFDAVTLNAEAQDMPGICQSTNGLASGNTRDEAIFHALCELIERDGYTRWEMLPAGARLRTSFDPLLLGDSELDNLVGRVLRAGKQVAFFDQTTDIGVPVVMALIADGSTGKKFDLAAGYGAHPNAARAAIRAITEAAQTRITTIAAARDDIAPGEFGLWASDIELELASGRSSAGLPPPSLKNLGQGFAIGQIVDALQAAVVAEPIVVPLDDGSLPCAVVRLLSADLEDVEANLNWRPGSRAARWFLK